MKLIDIHLTNVTGLGAEKFASGLIHHLFNNINISVENVYASKKLKIPCTARSVDVKYKICKTGPFARVLEVFFWRYRHSQKNDLLILGDLPLNTSVKQYVLCHQALMFKTFRFTSLNFLKFALFRLIFKIFLKEKDTVIVQTQEMAMKFRESFGPKINVETLDVTPDYFGWPMFYRSGRHSIANDGHAVTLIYPSAYYPHKNHHLLNEIYFDDTTIVKLTISRSELKVASDSIVFLERLSRDEIFDLYKTVDALLFLSCDESLGMPILEAIKCNLPIICPYAEYTRRLNDKNCFFFDLDDPSSLQTAIETAKSKILAGWWPQWSFSKSLKDKRNLSIEKILD